MFSFSNHLTTNHLPSFMLVLLFQLCVLISYAGSSGLGQRGPHCRVAQQNPLSQALCSGSPGANPLPCLPASVHMNSYGHHMWSCRKADAVFPFVKSSFWKAVSILMARVKSVSECKGERAVRSQRAPSYCVVLCANAARSGMKVWSSLWGYADLAKQWHSISLMARTVFTLAWATQVHRVQRHTHTVLMWTCL